MSPSYVYHRKLQWCKAVTPELAQRKVLTLESEERGSKERNIKHVWTPSNEMESDPRLSAVMRLVEVCWEKYWWSNWWQYVPWRIHTVIYSKHYHVGPTQDTSIFCFCFYRIPCCRRRTVNTIIFPVYHLTVFNFFGFHFRFFFSWTKVKQTAPIMIRYRRPASWTYF